MIFYLCRMKNLKKMFSVLLLVSFLSIDASAQCAMCRANAESNLKSNQNMVGRGLNKGILYLLSVPYLVGGAAFFIWYKNRKR